MEGVAPEHTANAFNSTAVKETDALALMPAIVVELIRFYVAGTIAVFSESVNSLGSDVLVRKECAFE